MVTKSWSRSCFAVASRASFRSPREPGNHGLEKSRIGLNDVLSCFVSFCSMTQTLHVSHIILCHTPTLKIAIGLGRYVRNCIFQFHLKRVYLAITKSFQLHLKSIYCYFKSVFQLHLLSLTKSCRCTQGHSVAESKYKLQSLAIICFQDSSPIG